MIRAKYSGVEKDLMLGINTVVNVADVVPDVTAGAVYIESQTDDPAWKTYGCEYNSKERTPCSDDDKKVAGTCDGNGTKNKVKYAVGDKKNIINGDKLKGKYCIVDRGGCFFQTKYDNCVAHGAVGVIVVNRDDSLFAMSVTKVDKTVPFVMTGKTNGKTIKDNIDTVQISMGRGIGPKAPLAEYSAPDGLAVMNPYTGTRKLFDAPFRTADGAMYDAENELFYAVAVNGQWSVALRLPRWCLAAPQLPQHKAEVRTR